MLMAFNFLFLKPYTKYIFEEKDNMQYVRAVYKTNMLYFSEPSNNENKS